MGRPCFYYNDDEFNTFAKHLKLMPCPHCHVVGALIRHGSLYGYDDSSPQRKTLRARRIFCSNRHARTGCGRTFSVWLADKIRRLSVTTRTLWQFLQHAVRGTLDAAIHAIGGPLSGRTWQRLWKRFRLGQTTIRTALRGQCLPPELSAGQPATEVLAHLRTTFPDAACPIAAFQHTLRTFFV